VTAPKVRAPGIAKGFAGQAQGDQSTEIVSDLNGIQFIEVAHDSDCPGRYEDGRGCTCAPTLTHHRDVQRFMRGEAVNRATRRKAAREAVRAMRRASKAGK